ncbi:MAG TPA: cupin domain-containing protein [Firmicutes bacterium]|nr:cupin domain-containing protein [Bacillota bacterium]
MYPNNQYYHSPYNNHPQYSNQINSYPQTSHTSYPYNRHDEFYFPTPNMTQSTELKDYGPQPLVVNIEAATKANNNFRTVLWTGSHLQLTLMSLNVGEEIGLETHPNLDQFIRVEDGQGLVMMGDTKDNLNFQVPVNKDFAFIIPAGKWHNLINTGNTPLKLYSIYAPVQHPFGTIHPTKADASK